MLRPFAPPAMPAAPPTPEDALAVPNPRRVGAAPGRRCYTECVPTTRPRYSVTETDELRRALDEAARLWPEDRDDRGALLRRVLDEGIERIAARNEERMAKRLADIRAVAGSFSGMYPPGEAARLRDEWPE